MSGANSFAGNLVVNNGLLSYGGNTVFPSGNFTVNGGTLGATNFLLENTSSAVLTVSGSSTKVNVGNELDPKL